MRLHPNAKTTPKSRAELVEQVLVSRTSAAEVAEAFAISERTVWKWVKRYRSEGSGGLRDRSCAPKTIPHKTPLEREQRIRTLRDRRLVAWQIAGALRMARSTVAAVLRRLGLGKLRPLGPEAPVVRYERKHAGELVHIDTKRLGRFEKVGHRIHGDRTKRSDSPGWEFAYVCVDDASRLAYVEIHPDEHAETATGFLARAIKGFASLAIRVERVMSDNALCFLSHSFQDTCRQLGVRHLRTRPYRPQTNGKAERFIQTLLREWAYARPYSSSNARAKALPAWLDYYNRRRPHGSLGDLPPASRVLLRQ